MLSLLRQEQRESLDEMSITELRSLGQSFNIKSPTSQPKSELIEEILLAMYGDDEDMLVQETRGRQVNEVKVIRYDVYDSEDVSRVIAATDLSVYDKGNKTNADSLKSAKKVEDALKRNKAKNEKELKKLKQSNSAQNKKFSGYDII